MHELGLVQEIVRMADDASAGARVTRVIVEVGAFTAVMPDAMRFCFELAAQGTHVEGAALELIEIAGRARCRACALKQPMSALYQSCQCGSFELDWLKGHELKVKALEVI